MVIECPEDAKLGYGFDPMTNQMHDLALESDPLDQGMPGGHGQGMKGDFMMVTSIEDICNRMDCHFTSKSRGEIILLCNDNPAGYGDNGGRSSSRSLSSGANFGAADLPGGLVRDRNRLTSRARKRERGGRSCDRYRLPAQNGGSLVYNGYYR